MMPPERTPEKVTLEDLLRLKRAERPPADFWIRFEQDLRAKQLAAIIEKRPWWHVLHLPQAARAISRFQVPVGAAAVLALTFVVVGQHRFGSVSVDEASSVAPAMVAQVGVTAPAKAEATMVAAIVPTQNTPVASSVSVDIPVVAVAAAASSPATRPAELTSMIPWGPSQVETVSSVSNGLAQGINTGLEMAALPDLAVTTLLDNRVPAPEAKAVMARAVATEAKAVVAVAQTTSPRELRRARLMAGLVLADNSDGAENSRVQHGRELVTSSLSEDQLYDSVHRVGLGGDRLMLKF